ncbi:kelch-like protein 20 [Centruroides vittatus]|uniref:kelch-like protein 20 n=1 Tax=Centruroides vittatus TaxID=120091 RepID=UPI00350FEB4D
MYNALPLNLSAPHLQLVENSQEPWQTDEISVEQRDSQESFSGSSFSTLEQDEYHFVESTHPIEVLAGLNSLRLTKTFCDVTLCVEEEEYPCHRVVLASFSPYFKAMFAGEMAESQQNKVVLNGVEPKTLQLLLDYAYTAQVVISKANVQVLLSAANLLEVLPVRDACCRFLECHMEESNCLGIHCFAETHACIELQQKAKEFALKYFQDVVQQEEFLTLSRSKLIEFISSDELEVEKEEDVFEAVLLWLNYNVEVRKEEFEKIMEHIRLPLLSPYYLNDRVSTVPAIYNSPECRELLEEAKTYHLLPDRRHELSSPRSKPRKSMGTIDVIVAVGGEDDKVVLRSVECFDPVKCKWSSLACLPFAVSKHGLVVTGQNMLYMAGGEFPDGSASKSMWRYDPVFDSWQEMAFMNVARSELGLATLDGYIYAVGGWEGVSRLSSVERYDPVTNKWQFVASMKISLTSPAVVAHQGLLYVTGGAVLEDGDGIDLVQCYNPRTNSWNEVAPMLIARSGSAICVVKNLIYVLGGWHASTENTNKVECFNPKKNEWQFCNPMREKRYQPGVAVVNGKIYICGGEEGWDRYHDTMECYEPEKDQWTIIGMMQTSRSWLCCAPLQLSRSLFIQEHS